MPRTGCAAPLGPQHAVAYAWPGACRGGARYNGLREFGYLHLLLREAEFGPDTPAAGFSLRSLWSHLVHCLAGRTAPISRAGKTQKRFKKEGLKIKVASE